MKKNQKLDAIRHVLSTIFNSQEILKTLAPEFKWTGMGNLLGDYGELIAQEYYGLKRAPSGADGYDAITKDGKRVQVKANHSAKQIGLRGKADLLLVLKIKNDGNFEEIYYGLFDKALEDSSFSKRDNKRMISISKLKLHSV